MKARWKIAPHNGFYVEDSPDGIPIYSEFLAQMLRVVYQDDDGYEEFAVAAGDAASLRQRLNRMERDRARLLVKAGVWAAKAGLSQGKLEKLMSDNTA